MKFFIPTIGTKVVLTQPWEFWVYDARRNASLLPLVGLDKPVARTQVRDQEIDAYGCSVEIGRIVEDAQISIYYRAPNGKCDYLADGPLAANKRTDIGPILNIPAFDKDVPAGSKCYLSVWSGMRRRKITIPAGATLAVDRIYIRQKAEDFDSISFVLDMATAKQMGAKTGSYFGRTGARFWAKLGDVHNMEFDLHE